MGASSSSTLAGNARTHPALSILILGTFDPKPVTEKFDLTQNCLPWFNAHLDRISFQILKPEKTVSSRIASHCLDSDSSFDQPLTGLLQVFHEENYMRALRGCGRLSFDQRKGGVIVRNKQIHEGATGI